MKGKLTTASGSPIDDDQASITASGYTLIQDVHLTEKLAHFNRERIPERVVHAKGTGAHGYFEVTNDLSKYTRAAFLSEVGKKTDIFVRFSIVNTERGGPDANRDPRGFAVKFYTEEGNYDIVANNTPVFFVRDAIKFPDFIHSQKRNPKNNLHDYDTYWDFLSLTPESIHQVTILFTDRGTPKDYRHMDGFGTNTFMWYNEKNEYVWIKYTFKCDQGNETLTADEAIELKGKEADHATIDLYQEIENGNYPSWTVYVQIMTPEQAKKYEFDPFDATKVWYHGDFPLIPLGKIVLNKNPENYFDEVEQSAFAPSNMVPGIGASPDRMLQARLFAYTDTQRYRLGPNFQQLKINAPRALNVYQRDGPMSYGIVGTDPNYYPNSVPDAPAPDISYTPPASIVDDEAMRHQVPIDDVDFAQARALYTRVLSDKDKDHLISNIAGHLGGAKESIQYRQTALFYKVDEDYGTRVAEALSLDINKIMKLAAASQEEREKITMKM